MSHITVHLSKYIYYHKFHTDFKNTACVQMHAWVWCVCGGVWVHAATTMYVVVRGQLCKINPR